MRTLNHMMKVNKVLLRKIIDLQSRNKILKEQNRQLMAALQKRAFEEV